jgi:copper chaperone
MSISTYVFRVDGMHCASCPPLIDDAVEDVPGITAVHTELKAARSTVELDTTLATPQQVIDTISSLGYRASLQAGLIAPLSAQPSNPPRPARSRILDEGTNHKRRTER